MDPAVIRVSEAAVKSYSLGAFSATHSIPSMTPS